MKLVIIGNGFDLGCGLPTSYKDFFNFLKGVESDKFLKIDDFLNNRKFRSCSEETYLENKKQKTFIYTGSLGKNPRILAEEKFHETLKSDIRFVKDEFVSFASQLFELNVNFWELYFWRLSKIKVKQHENWFEIENQIKDLLLIFETNGKADYGFIFQDVSTLLKIDRLNYDDDSDFENVLSKTNYDSKIDALLKSYLDVIIKHHENDKYFALLIELQKFETQFRSYIEFLMSTYVSGNRSNLLIYRNNFLELIPSESKDLEFSVLNFNYSSFSDAENMSDSKLTLEFQRKKQALKIYETNVHGNYKRTTIFGIDQNKVETNSNAYQFTKTFRKMNEQEKLLSHSLPNQSEINEIIFFGHSLSEADYSYFQSIFDYYDIYHSEVKLSFLYSEYGDESGHVGIRRRQIKNVTNLIRNYGDTMDNQNHGRNLVHKLLLENRLSYRIVKLKEIKLVENGKQKRSDL